MASTNTTANYGLPQYIATDKPTYLGDFNGAMLSIDTAIKGVSDIAKANQGNIAQAKTDITDLDSRLGTIESETTVNTSDIATANQNIINLQSQTNTQGQQIATVTQATNANTLVIGSGQLETDAQTIIPAVNELNTKIGNLGKSGTRKVLYTSEAQISQGTKVTLNDNLSNFKFIGIEILVAGTNVMAILQIDVDGFKKTPRTFTTSQTSVTTPATHYMSSSLKYVDDTHVIVTGWGSGWAINYVNVYGIY